MSAPSVGVIAPALPAQHGAAKPGARPLAGTVSPARDPEPGFVLCRPKRPAGTPCSSRLRRDETGQAAEAVIVFPVLLLIIMSVVQFGLWYHASAVAKAAVAEGVRAARAEGGTGSDGSAVTEAFLAQAGPTVVQDVQLVVSRNDSVARVELRAKAANVLPGLRLPIHAVAESPVERFRPESEQAGGP